MIFPESVSEGKQRSGSDITFCTTPGIILLDKTIYSDWIDVCV
jgi:hypothetical protein